MLNEFLKLYYIMLVVQSPATAKLARTEQMLLCQDIGKPIPIKFSLSASISLLYKVNKVSSNVHRHPHNT